MMRETSPIHRCSCGRRRPGRCRSNQFAAVHPDLEYSVLSTEHDGKSQKLIVASALVETLRAKTKQELPETNDRVKGSQLIGRRYIPPFDHFSRLLFRSIGQDSQRKTETDLLARRAGGLRNDG